METADDLRSFLPEHALKPSLVEWKPVPASFCRLPFPALETFLSGMETRPGGRPGPGTPGP